MVVEGRGRPPAWTEKDIRAAEAMLKDTSNFPFVGDVIDQLKIGHTAFYKYFPPGRISELREQNTNRLFSGKL